ncbi:cobalt-precorrin-5B (C(1))-methyltransferase CbiD [Halarsenatibacter silvermanii]|uniref:Cobalt-precorrin-5B C(1)-methyltransferase n=1 Tax=Halarsenatibacter silvermanii TaxID=321763 RepID=A0A1G9Q2S1_9FIRM|nr:cobalt-precorrin-5B (C(1))-methyltransferase CbiD [Halarsenatibacter silvermanii]SDM05338.1 cobalt-precorrin 5B C1-methyltransferase [Halarsenatibacter silvermanii]
MDRERKTNLAEENRDRDLKKGFTTGSAAAAAARAAALMIRDQQRYDRVEIDTPAGIRLELELADADFSAETARASIIKDAGDDPDITDGLEIAVRLELCSDNEITAIEAGSGVGTVTEPGLPVDPGEPAINPVPRQMITEQVENILGQTGCRVIVSAPGGEELTRQTFNPRLGIEGGISILGTSGLVEPMSDKAYRESLALELSQAAARGRKKVVLVFGNYSRDKALDLGFAEDIIIRMSNFVGFMLEKSCEEDLEEILLIGQLGKLVKVAAGVFNTHSSTADARLETLAAYSASLGLGSQNVREILSCGTSEEAAEIIEREDLQEVYPLLAEKIVERAGQRCGCDLKIGAVIFSMRTGLLGSAGGISLLDNLEGARELADE